MTALWTPNDIAAALGQAEKILRGECTGLSIDSRAIATGDLFIALRGENFNGADYVDDALARGAVGAIADQSYSGKETDHVFVVEDTMTALLALATAARARSSAKIVAVTGSVGKTSTKEAMALVLGHFGKAHATAGNLNNHIGLPLTLARMPADTDYAVLEMGMNHAGEIAPLSQLARPHVAVITTVDAVHLENFADVGGIADAKAEILSGLDPRMGLAILPRDNPYYPRLLAAAADLGIEKIKTFGQADVADAKVLHEDSAQGKNHFDSIINGKNINFFLQPLGSHWPHIALMILLICDAWELNLDLAANEIANITPPAGRGQANSITLADGRQVMVMDETYNASPASVTAALATLARPPAMGRRIAILGDMLELGETGPQLHASLASAVVEGGADRVFCCGPLMRHLFDALPPSLRGEWAANSKLLAAAITEFIENGDLLLVKGSRGMKMELILSALRAA